MPLTVRKGVWLMVPAFGPVKFRILMRAIAGPVGEPPELASTINNRELSPGGYAAALWLDRRATGEAIHDAMAHGRIDYYVLRPAGTPDEDEPRDLSPEGQAELADQAQVPPLAAD